MRRILIIYNEQSGHGSISAQLGRITDVFAGAGCRVTAQPVRFDANPFEGGGEYDLAVVCGGDGTVNHIVNAMKSSGRDIPLGIIPAGTANDFARALGMSHDAVEAARQIACGRTVPVDCGVVNGHYFINVFSFGLFTTTSQHTPDGLKHRLGKIAYIIEGAKELRQRRAIPLEIRYHDGMQQHECSVDSIITLIFNGETAGGFHLARQASLRDGMFDCAILESRNFIVDAVASALYLATGKPNFAVRQIRASHMEISSPLAPPTDADGQHGADFPLVIDGIKGGISVVCP